MRNTTSQIRTYSILVLTLVVTAENAKAELPPEALAAYVNAYEAMGKRAAFMFSQKNVEANAQTNRMTASANVRASDLASQADAHAKMMAAKTPSADR